MNGSFRAGSLFGIPFNVNRSWFLILGLVTWSYGSGLAFQFGGAGGLLPWLLGLVTALLMFASVIAHELGHSFAALRQGINVKSITLFMFGGLADLDRESDTPGGAFKVAIAGPLVSLGLFGLLTAIATNAPLPGSLVTVVGALAYINLALALFNMIPGLPLDGGNVLKAVVWKLTGNPYRGVKFASRMGQLFGWTAVIFGLLSVFGLSSVGSIWTLLIGWFLLQNASRSAQSADVQEQLTGLTAGDAVIPESPIVSAEISLRDFADELVLSKGNWRRFIVTDTVGRLMGEIAADTLKSVPNELWSQTRVKDLLKPVDQTAIVPSSQPLLEILQKLEQQQRSEFWVTAEDGGVLGLLRKASIRQLLQSKPQLDLA
ncbi:MAG: site-2 protease family protein [Synechococcus sp.]